MRAALKDCGHKVLTCVPLGLVLWAFALPASAQPEARTFTLQYEHDEDCPNIESFLGRLRDRTAVGTMVATQPADLDFRVKVASGEPANGAISWTEGSGSANRTVEAADCSEVVSALALVLALVLDSDGESQPLPDSHPPSQPVPVPQTTQPVQRKRLEPAVFSTTTRTTFGFGVSGGWAGGIAPNPAFVQGLFAELAWDRDGGLSPMLRAAWLRGAQSTTTSDGSFRMSWWTARLTACPSTLRASAWFARPCALFDVGRLHGSGYQVRDAADGSAVWYGPGAQIFAGMTLMGALTITASGGVVAPLARDRFLFAPDVVAHEIPWLAGFALLSVGGEL